MICCKTLIDDGEKLVWIPVEEVEESKIKPDFIKEYIYKIISDRNTFHVLEESDR